MRGQAPQPHPQPQHAGGRAGAVAAVALAALLWSSSYAVTKEVLDEVGPLSIGAVRFTLAAALLALLVRLRRAAPPIGVRQRWGLYASGLLGITLYFVLENVGVELSTASDASLIVATYPLMTMLVELAVHRLRIAPLRVVGVLLAAGGAALVVRTGAEAGGQDRLTGNVLLLLGGLVWAAYNVVTKRVSRGQHVVGVTFHQTVAGAAGFLVASLLEAGQWRAPSGGGVAMLAYLGVACSVGAFLLYNHGLRRLPSSTAVSILNLVPVFGVVGAVVVNGEPVLPLQVIGGLVIVLGVSLGVVQRRPTPADEARPEPAVVP